jgi:CBS domain containing-hemolysin-like protein
VFGEIDDEYDEEEQAEELLAQELGPNAWLFSARHEVEDLNERFGLALPDDEGDYTTLGGLLMHFAERIPAVKEQVVVGDYTLTVEEGSQRKIETIRLVATDAS